MSIRDDVTEFIRPALKKRHGVDIMPEMAENGDIAFVQTY
jgi:hypothetical protein